jgi:hypothetical protein
MSRKLDAMTDRPPAADRSDAPDRYPGTPGWVKVAGVVLLVLLLLVGFVLVTGLGGPHGPQRHGASAAWAASLAASHVGW